MTGTLRTVAGVLVGRQQETAVLDALLADAEQGLPGVVLVTGEAGVGKTRLLSELADRAVARGVRVLAGGCVELSRGELALGPFVEALRPVLRQPADAPGTTSGLAAELARLLLRDGQTGGEVPSPGPGEVFRLVLELLGALADDRPVLLLLEDLHWADVTSVDLLSYLVHNLCQTRSLVAAGAAESLLIVASCRTEEPDATPQSQALAELGRRAGTRPLELRRLSRDETRQLLDQLLDEPADDGFAEAVHARSEGNAYIVRELAAAGPAAAGRDLPSSLRALFHGRTAGLSVDGRLVVSALAVLGRRCPHDLLVAACDLPEQRLLDAVREAVGHGLLLVEGDCYAFRHALLRESAYDALLPGERIRLHRRVADALTAAGAVNAAGAAELAAHRTSARQWDLALVASLQAGRLAADLHAFAEAELWLTRALELWPQVPSAAELCGTDRVAVAAETAAAAHCAGSTLHAVAVCMAALAEASDPAVRARLHERLGRYQWEAGDADAALAADRAAVAELEGGPPSPLQARALAALGAGLMVVGELDEAVLVCGRAIALAEQVSADSARTYALTSRGVALAMRGELDEGLACLQEAAAAVQAGEAPDDVCRVYANLSYVLTGVGRLEDSLAATSRGIARAREQGVDGSAGAVLLVNAADTLLLLGRWAEAEALASGALQRDVPPLFAGHLRVTWAQLLVATGRYDEAAAVLDEVGHPDGAPALTAARCVAEAELAVARRRWTAVSEAVDRGLASSGADPVLAVRLCALGARSAAELSRAARVDRDEAAVAAARRRAEQLVADAALRAGPERELPEMAALLLTCAAEVAELLAPAAAGAWDDVVAAWEATEQRPRLAGALLRLAEDQFGARRRRQGEQSLRRAHALAHDLAAAPLLERAEQLAARVRIPLELPAAVSPGGPERRSAALHLTPRERQVLSFVAAGRTNRQIARSLYISEKTSGVHVSNILGKLGAANRSEAAATAHALDLVPGWREEVMASSARGGPG